VNAYSRANTRDGPLSAKARGRVAVDP
jgi:hypothetical protein